MQQKMKCQMRAWSSLPEADAALMVWRKLPSLTAVHCDLSGCERFSCSFHGVSSHFAGMMIFSSLLTLSTSLRPTGQMTPNGSFCSPPSRGKTLSREFLKLQSFSNFSSPSFLQTLPSSKQVNAKRGLNPSNLRALLLFRKKSGLGKTFLLQKWPICLFLNTC